MGVKSQDVLKAKSSAELLSYIINENPILREEIDLPRQGEGIEKIGSLIMSNNRYKNAFLDTVNLIGLTVIKRNHWKNPWGFTDRGELDYGQQIREVINDLCKVYDYNETVVPDNEFDFIKTEVPNVLSTMYEINYQKYYKTTTSDEQMAMAFKTGDLFSFINDVVSMLYESMDYDLYLVNKYMLCRRLVDGTVTTHKLDTSLTPREIVAEMKEVSNNLAFRSPNFNPAALERATDYENQRTILANKWEAKFSTEVLATSYFKDQAELRTKLSLIDTFDETNEKRLTALLGDQYVPFTIHEKETLRKVIGVVLSDEWFMDYKWKFEMGGEDAGAKKTEFYNPQTLRTNHFLHVWYVLATSPFENACVFVTEEPTVTGVTVSPSTATVNAGQSLKLSASVQTTGLANKAVMWTTNSSTVTIDQFGNLKVPAAEKNGTVEVTATSIFNNMQKATATITIVELPA